MKKPFEHVQCLCVFECMDPCVSTCPDVPLHADFLTGCVCDRTVAVSSVRVLNMYI